MNESEKIATLFEAFYDGECWIGLNFKQAIKGVDEKLAARKKGDAFNSIWQLVNHIIYWRKTVMIRLQGVLGNPPMPDFTSLINLKNNHGKKPSIILKKYKKNW